MRSSDWSSDVFSSYLGNSSSDHDNGSNEIASDGDPSQSQDNEAADGPEADGSDPFADVLDENAAFDDFIDDLRDAIAANPLPEEMPDATDGEVDPEEIVETIDQANSVAPDYTSPDPDPGNRSEEHTSELQSLMRISYAVLCLKKKKQNNRILY